MNEQSFFEKEPVSLYLDKLMLIKEIKSLKQKIQLFEHDYLGKVLVINGEIQHIEKYQSLYHELLVHLPMSFIKSPQKVLILGGGSLFAAFEVLKYPSVEMIILCDYDRTVLELMREHYSHAIEVFNDNRFYYIEEDARIYIETKKQKYDLIINDCFNLVKESQISKKSYFNLLTALTTQNGVCVDIIYRHIFDQQTTIDTLHMLQKEKHLALSLVTVPEYPGILHLETIWGKNQNIYQNQTQVNNEYQQQLLLQSTTPFIFYNPRNLPYYLYLPPYIKEKFIL